MAVFETSSVCRRCTIMRVSYLIIYNEKLVVDIRLR